VTQNKEEILGKILQEERKAKKISQEKLAKLTGLDRTFISLIENGKRNPRLTRQIPFPAFRINHAGISASNHHTILIGLLPVWRTYRAVPKHTNGCETFPILLNSRTNSSTFELPLTYRCPVGDDADVVLWDCQ
jgi:DNA-binding XRE family transcriptional regulator